MANEERLDYSTFLDRLARWRVPVRQIARVADLSEDTVYRYIRDGRRLPGEAIYAIADDLHMTAEETALELLGIEPRKTQPLLTDDELLEVLAGRLRG